MYQLRGLCPNVHCPIDLVVEVFCPPLRHQVLLELPVYYLAWANSQLRLGATYLANFIVN